MAPLTSFIKLSKDSVLPVRVTINRKAILNHNVITEHAVPASATHNNKAVIRLHRTLRIKLSNRDMRDLIDDVKARVLEVCLETSIESLVAQYQQNGELDLNDSVRDKNKLVIPITSAKGWKCLMVLYVKSIESLRLSLAGELPVVPKGDRFGSGATQLLIRDMQFTERVVLREEEDEGVFEVEDNKKGMMSVKYQGKSVVNRGIDIVVLSRP